DLNRYYAETGRITTRCASLEETANGPVLVACRMRAEAGPLAQVEQVVTLYHHAPRIDIECRVTKEEWKEKEAVHLAFPFDLPEATYAVNRSGYVIDPHRDLTEASFKDHLAVQNWMDVHSSARDPRGVVFSPRDAPIVQLGGMHFNRWIKEVPTDSPSLYSLLMSNFWEVGNFPMTQRGAFTFRYALTPYVGEFSAQRAM